MLKIDTKPGEITITANLSVPFSDTWDFIFAFHEMDDIKRGFLTDSLRRAFTETIRRIKCVEYNRGFKDGRGHRLQATYFDGSLE